SSVINDKKSDAGVSVPAGGIEQELKMKPEEEMCSGTLNLAT
ncbi:conjugal transfer protein TraD, partial [Escherichia coli]|nr:conjugal transfer protein TraD [Escherichia coli]